MLLGQILAAYPTNTYLFKVNKRNTRKRCEMCPKLTIKTSERVHWHSSDVFFVNFESYLTYFSSVFIVDFEQVNASWIKVGR